jgi:hypothetical protein
MLLSVMVSTCTRGLGPFNQGRNLSRDRYTKSYIAMQWRDAKSLRCKDGDVVIYDTKILTMGQDRSNRKSFLCSKSELSMDD